MNESGADMRIHALGKGTVANQDPLKFLLKIQKDSKIGGDIPQLTPEVQEGLKVKLGASEARLNDLFPTAILADRKNIAPSTKFLDRPQFFKEAILEGREVDVDLNHMLELMVETFNTGGKRSFDGKKVMVHTTVYDEKDDPRSATENEAFSTARHEIVHGKVEPRIITLSPTKQERRTGSKIVTLENGKVTDVKHSCLYEAQTDALAVISSHPEAQSFDEIFHLYLEERAGDNSEYGFQMSALTRLMDYAFPDFMTGLTVLGENYFRADSEGFIAALSDKIKEKGNDVVWTEFNSFLRYSEMNNAPAMTQSVTRILNSARGK